MGQELVGKKVRVVGCLSGHRFDIGDVVLINEFDDGGYFSTRNDVEGWLYPEDFELIEESKPKYSIEELETLSEHFNRRRRSSTSFCALYSENNHSFVFWLKSEGASGKIHRILNPMTREAMKAKAQSRDCKCVAGKDRDSNFNEVIDEIFDHFENQSK